jgi:hypothetical protein
VAAQKAEVRIDMFGSASRAEAACGTAMPPDVRRWLCPAVGWIIDVGLRPRFETEQHEKI